jgi:hypothetical protein
MRPILKIVLRMFLVCHKMRTTILLNMGFVKAFCAVERAVLEKLRCGAVPGFSFVRGTFITSIAGGQIGCAVSGGHDLKGGQFERRRKQSESIVPNPTGSKPNHREQPSLGVVRKREDRAE